MQKWLSVVGIGEDGLPGLSQVARSLVEQAEVLVGGDRHQAMLPTDDPREKMVWTTPIAHSIDKIVRRRGQSICVLASGDPKQKLLQWHSEFGGELTRIAIQRAEPLGKFLGWKAMAPVTQWLVVKLFAA